MPEDQNYEGDIWNKEASKFLSAFHWSQIGDFDMDIKNNEDKEKGIDRLFEYGLFSNYKAGIVLEAKCYKTTTFLKNKNLLEEWITILYEKVVGIRSSAELKELFPQTGNTIFKDGLIVVWFKDIENYNPEIFYKLYERVRLRRSSRGITKPNRIFVLENSNILKLISIQNHIKQICDIEDKFVFHYPSGYQSNSVVQSEIMSIEFLFSKFILGELKDKEGKTKKKVVFYFGNPTLCNFYRLKSALSKLQFLERDTNLLMFNYKRNKDLRKIYPEISKEFIKDLNNEKDRFEFLDMDILADLPSWITSTKY